MPLQLSEILTNFSQTLDNTGFFFGAGTSYEAGFPLMSGLTKQVIDALTINEKTLLEEILGHYGETYNNITCEPNIEHIFDQITKHYVTTQNPIIGNLESRIRDLIVECILDVKTVNLDYHQQFFDLLQRKYTLSGQSIWIFTTNYDILLETAAAQAGVFIENGFSGGSVGFFNPDQFMHTTGTVQGSRFTARNKLTVKLVKLHGSVSWVQDGTKLYERHPLSLSKSDQRVMILPQRKKILDTLESPYSTLLRIANQVMGKNCKHIASCGFSFADDHINEHLILPALSKKCNLFTLNQSEPSGISSFKAYPNFHAGFENGCYINRADSPETTNLWKFSEFVKLFN